MAAIAPKGLFSTPRRILAVDDDPGTREFYREILEGAGYLVRTASDAASGIVCCADFPPDVLLLDWDMPGCGGGQVFHAVCDQLRRRIPVLFITGFPGKIQLVNFRVKVAILRKPAGIKTVLSEVERLLLEGGLLSLWGAMLPVFLVWL